MKEEGQVAAGLVVEDLEASVVHGPACQHFHIERQT